MDEKYIILGLAITAAALITVVIDLVIGIIRCREKLKQLQKDKH